MSRLNAFISRIDLTATTDFIKARGKPVSYTKGTPLVEAGSRCRYAGIILSGYFKFSTINTKGNEVVAGFLFKGDVIMDYVRGFLRGEPSLISIIAGSDAELLRVPIDDLRRYIMDKNDNFVATTSSVLLHEAYSRYLDVLIKTPAERYRELMDRCPDDINILPVGEVASFLRVSRRQLHRIRGDED